MTINKDAKSQKPFHILAYEKMFPTHKSLLIGADENHTFWKQSDVGMYNFVQLYKP